MISRPTASPGADGATAAGADANDPRARPPDQLPLWFERGFVVIVSAVLFIGGFGLLLAVFGHYSAPLAFVVGGLGTVLGSLLAWPRRGERIEGDAGNASPASARRRVRLPALGMCVVALGFALWNGVEDGHYVSVDRDPGVYAVAGKWIAANGSLEVPAGKAWSSKGPEFDWTSAGMSPADATSLAPNGDGKLEFQFNHLAPVLFAEAQGIGGDRLMFATPALLGALALGAIYAAGCRLVRRPYLVLVAVTALALSLPQISVARDTYSETSAQLLVWGGLWLLLVAYERRRLGMAVLGGMALAGAMLSRIDAQVYVIPLPMLGALALVSARSRADRRFLWRMYAMLALGAVPFIALGTFDVRNRSGLYYGALSSQVTELRLGFVASLAVAGAILAIWPRVHRLSAWAQRRRATLATVAGSVAVFGLILAWSVRPAVQHATGVYNPTVATLQQAEGLAVDGTRTYDERTMVWISWYLGPIGLGLAVIGIGLLVFRLIRRPEPAVALLLTVAGTGTALYLWTDQITPSQIWAMRRYVPAALPFLVLSAAYALDLGLNLLPRLGVSRSWSRLVTAVPVVAMVGFPLGATLPVRNFESQANFLTVVNKTCAAIGPNAAVMFMPDDRARLTLPQTMRSFCGVPATQLQAPMSAARLATVAGQWQAQGRTLWVLATGQSAIAKALPGLNSTLVADGVNNHQLNETISRAPSSYSTEGLSMYAAKVTP